MKANILTAAAFAALTMVPFGASAQTETWKPIGTGTIRDDLRTAYYLLDYFPEFEVQVEESEQTPGRYRLVDAYRNCPSLGGGVFPEDVRNYLIVDASDPVHVYVERGLTAYFIGEGQNMAVWSIADDYYNSRYGDWVLADEEGVCGSCVGGNITFPRGALLAAPFEGLEQNDDLDDIIWKRANQNNGFLIKIPGAADIETRLGASSDFKLSDDGYLEFNLVMGKDLDYVKIGVVEDEWYDGLMYRVADGTIDSFEVKESGTVRIPYDHDGTFSVIALPYYKGEPYIPGGSHDTRFWNFDFSEWEPVGNATYTDAVIHANYLFDYNQLNRPAYTYEVPMEQNRNNRSIVRLVNPYGPCYPEYNALSYNGDRNYYMTFDLTYADCVMLDKMEYGIGLEIGDTQTMQVVGHAKRQMTEPPYGEILTLEQVRTSPDVKRIHYDEDTRSLTAEPSAIRVTFPTVNPGVWYDANTDGSFKVVLPEGVKIPSGVRGLGSEEDARTLFYDLNGLPVDVDALTPGVYVRKSGGRTEKILIR